jgi:hypothetical protein
LEKLISRKTEDRATFALSVRLPAGRPNTDFDALRLDFDPGVRGSGGPRCDPPPPALSGERLTCDMDFARLNCTSLEGRYSTIDYTRAGSLGEAMFGQGRVASVIAIPGTKSIQSE